MSFFRLLPKKSTERDGYGNNGGDDDDSHNSDNSDIDDVGNNGGDVDDSNEDKRPPTSLKASLHAMLRLRQKSCIA